MTTPKDSHDALPLDEHLLAALRHAPDRELTPPSHVAQAILAAAEQVHRAPAPAVPPPATVRAQPERHVSLAERLQALLAPRWAGSVAAGLVAALVVGLWYEEELPAPVSTERVAAQTQGESRPAAPNPPPVAPARIEPEAPVPATAPAPAPPRTAAPARSPTDRSAEARNKAATAPSSEAALRPAKPEAAAPPVDAAVAPPAAAPAAAVAPPPAAEPAATAAKASATRDARTAVADAAAPAGAGAPTTADTQRRAESALAAPSAVARSADAGAASVGALRLAPGPGASAAGAGAASPALTLLRRARADIDARGAIWTWQSASGTSARSFDADAQVWLQRLVVAARGRWVDVAERSDGGVATELRWWRNDEPVAVLRIEALGLRWIEPSSRIRFAPMSADELARLGTP